MTETTQGPSSSGFPSGNDEKLQAPKGTNTRAVTTSFGDATAGLPPGAKFSPRDLLPTPQGEISRESIDPYAR
jgi:hypothetical protein